MHNGWIGETTVWILQADVAGLSGYFQQMADEIHPELACASHRLSNTSRLSL